MNFMTGQAGSFTPNWTTKKLDNQKTNKWLVQKKDGSTLESEM